MTTKKVSVPDGAAADDLPTSANQDALIPSAGNLAVGHATTGAPSATIVGTGVVVSTSQGNATPVTTGHAGPSVDGKSDEDPVFASQRMEWWF
jgi:hypothetical protein